MKSSTLAVLAHLACLVCLGGCATVKTIPALRRLAYPAPAASVVTGAAYDAPTTRRFASEAPAPSTPSTRLSAAATAHGVTLKWVPAVATAGDPITATNIYRNGTKLGSITPTTATYQDTAVTAGASYSYYVTSTDSNKSESVPSNAVSVTVPSDTPTPTPVPTPIPAPVTPPVTPTRSIALLATPAALKLTAAVNASVTATFTVDDQGPFLPFRVTVDQPWLTVSPASGTTAQTAPIITLTAHAPATAGTYTAHAIITAGPVANVAYTNSPLSIPITLTVPAPPVTPPVTVPPAATNETELCTVVLQNAKSFTAAITATGTSGAAASKSVKSNALPGTGAAKIVSVTCAPVAVN